MNLQEAIIARHSVRQYQDIAIEAEKITKLQALIDEYNQLAGLHIQLVTNEPKAFAGGLAKYGKFSGVSNYIVMVGQKGSDEALGYYGEQIVLQAQTMGLNTCWVGLTFRKQPDQYAIGAGEVLNSVIALGYGATQGVQHPQKKAVSDVTENKSGTAYPDWFVKGVEAALLAPTAINQQKFFFILHPDNRVEAKARFALSSYTQTDLGIAKCHFEIGAGKENFTWKK